MRAHRHVTIFSCLVAATVLVASASVGASGPIGLYAILERVVFEPNEAAPERIQLWGAFAYAEGGVAGSGQVSQARRGYLYFRVSTDVAAAAQTRREWNDLKSVAGSGQAIGFGKWGYVGGFGNLDPAARTTAPPYILDVEPGRSSGQTDMRVRPASERPSNPTVYQMDSGVVRISASGSRATLVSTLQAALKAL